MNKLSLSLFSRFYVIIVTAVFISAVFTYMLTETLLEREEIKYFAREAELIVSYVEQNLTKLEYEDQAKTIITLPYPFKLDFTAQLVDLSQANKVNKQQLTCQNCKPVSNLNQHVIYELEDGEKYVSLPLNRIQSQLVLYQKLDHERLDAELEQYREESDPEKLTLFTLFTVLALLLAIALYLPIKKLQRQINQLIKTQQAFGHGDLTVRANEQLQQPIQGLAKSFNQMASAINANVKERDIFAQAIPHEVRTPLSRIQLATGLAKKKCSDESVQGLLENIDDYVNDINLLISQIVEFAKVAAEHSSQQNCTQAIDVTSFISARINLLSEINNIEVELISDTCPMLLTNPMYLRLLTDNLIKNALNYANSKVRVSVSQTQQGLSITVEDDGIGILESDREKVFIPFARLDKSRNRATGGLGLGLAIAKAAAEKMSGGISISHSNLTGAKFTFACTHSKAPN